MDQPHGAKRQFKRQSSSNQDTLTWFNGDGFDSCKINPRIVMVGALRKRRIRMQADYVNGTNIAHRTENTQRALKHVKVVLCELREHRAQ